MARYVTSVRSPWPAERAFDYLADLRNFEAWDPGVESSVQVAGDGPGLGAAYDVKVTGSRLRYETVEFEHPRELLVVARTRRLTSRDRISVGPDDGGCVVTYDAVLTLNGVLRVADPLLALAFRRIGDRAATGLAAALEGAIVF